MNNISFLLISAMYDEPQQPPIEEKLADAEQKLVIQRQILVDLEQENTVLINEIEQLRVRREEDAHAKQRQLQAERDELLLVLKRADAAFDAPEISWFDMELIKAAIKKFDRA